MAEISHVLTEQIFYNYEFKIIYSNKLFNDPVCLFYTAV